ncbi:hypothetical protein MA16_Dca002999 [Dendrobium catenatum]|uniref:Uncharacterized protein n=1 Tax=Dendrobium catenatum TaxID=906689 RepID=A0A2I0X9A9_9ASPA|nr:hypothetical protein MA16_Dca002999 [Dendrobium catenatum]
MIGGQAEVQQWSMTRQKSSDVQWLGKSPATVGSPAEDRRRRRSVVGRCSVFLVTFHALEYILVMPCQLTQKTGYIDPGSSFIKMMQYQPIFYHRNQTIQNE